MKVRIEAVISTAGNNEEYVGKHLGLELLGRPLTRMVVTFEEEMTNNEFWRLRGLMEQDENEKICKQLRLGLNALQIHSFSVTRNFQH